MSSQYEDERITKQIRSMLNDNPNLKEYYLSIQDIACSSAYNYLLHVKSFLEYCEKESIDITPLDFENYMNSIENKPSGEATSLSYRATAHTALKKYGSLLVSQNIMNTNPMEKIARPKIVRHGELSKEDKRVYLTKDEVQKLIQSVKDGVGNERSKKRQAEWMERDLSIVTFFLTTGIKSAELLRLNTSDVDVINKQVSINNKKYDLSEEMVHILETWISKRRLLLNDHVENALFISNRRTRLNQGSLNNILDKYSSVQIPVHLSTVSDIN